MAQKTEPLLSSAKPLTAGETPQSIALGERIVHYVLRRAKRRTLALSVDHRGLRVGAPPRASQFEVESLILRHSAWVVQKLDEWHSRHRPELVPIVDGVQLPLLGKPIEVRLALGNNRAIWSAYSGLTLCLRSPAEAGRVLEKALRERARELFGERLSHYAALHGLTLPGLTLSSARTRWGSCSFKSGIRLNWRLIHFPPHIIDYVVAHELAHLREMNHSPRFWSIVEQIFPDFKAARAELKRVGAHYPRW
jgi:predicted metal-dependent hydrolase